jgi:hypothetical protein
MNAFVCPKGHASADADYCSECGAKILGAAPAGHAADEAIPLPATTAAECPDCGTVRENTAVAFCEICGYNFNTGARGEVPVTMPAPAAPPAPAPAAAVDSPTGWMVTVSVDPTLHKPGSPEPPADVPPFSFAVKDPVSLIGRKSAARAIFPEIALDYDEAVSRRHALLQLSPDGALLLRDIGAANGTELNGRAIAPMVDHPLKDGDQITLGHWTRITVAAAH